jgi:hypothetical protein
VDNNLLLASLPFVEKYQHGAAGSVLLRLALNVAQAHRTTGNDLVLMTTKAAVRRAAQQEGIISFNPERQSQADLDGLLGP